MQFQIKEFDNENKFELPVMIFKLDQFDSISKFGNMVGNMVTCEHGNMVWKHGWEHGLGTWYYMY